MAANGLRHPLGGNEKSFANDTRENQWRASPGRQRHGAWTTQKNRRFHGMMFVGGSREEK